MLVSIPMIKFLYSWRSNLSFDSPSLMGTVKLPGMRPLKDWLQSCLQCPPVPARGAAKSPSGNPWVFPINPWGSSLGGWPHMAPLRAWASQRLRRGHLGPRERRGRGVAEEGLSLNLWQFEWGRWWSTIKVLWVPGVPYFQTKAMGQRMQPNHGWLL